MAAGNFNTGLFRLNALVAVCLLQAWLMWNFIMFQVKRMREAKSFAASNAANAAKARKSEQERGRRRRGIQICPKLTKILRRISARGLQPNKPHLTTLTCSLPHTMVINLVLHHMFKYFYIDGFAFIFP